jgi:hypothetical protein
MKRAIIAASVIAMLASPAFAGGNKSQSLNLNIGVATGKGGILGALLGTVKGKNGLVTNVNATTTKGGILGLVLGNGGGHGGCGCGY